MNTEIRENLRENKQNNSQSFNQEQVKLLFLEYIYQYNSQLNIANINGIVLERSLYNSSLSPKGKEPSITLHSESFQTSE